MRHNSFRIKSRLMVLCVAAFSMLLLISANATAQTKAGKTPVTKFQPEVEQSIYREYRGVKLNMSMTEARAKLGTPVFKSDELDYFVFSENETAQVAYNSQHKVATISVDYLGGVGAPDYMTVVGGSLLERRDGSLYRMVEYAGEGFWVSFNKSAGPVSTITITLQLLQK